VNRGCTNISHESITLKYGLLYPHPHTVLSSLVKQTEKEDPPREEPQLLMCGDMKHLWKICTGLCRSMYKGTSRVHFGSYDIRTCTMQARPYGGVKKASDHAAQDKQSGLVTVYVQRQSKRTWRKVHIMATIRS
jgi:hypothetical protein